MIAFRQFLCSIVLILCFASGHMVWAQESQEATPKYGWKRQIVGNVNLTQASFDNWEQGGESTLAWQVNLNTNFTLGREKYSWSNTGKFTLGFAKVGDTEAKKSDDVIKIESVFTRKLTKLLNPFVAITAKTQFVSGFEFDGEEKTKVSEFMDPGYFTQSFGVGYAPNELFKTRLGFTVKETITSDFPIPYADDPDTPEIEKTRIEPGISSITNVKKNFQEDVLFTSRLDIFSDLEAFDRIDVLWENEVTLKVTKFINVNVSVDLLYDKDISDKHQLKQVLAVGLTYAFLQ